MHFFRKWQRKKIHRNYYLFHWSLFQFLWGFSYLSVLPVSPCCLWFLGCMTSTKNIPHQASSDSERINLLIQMKLLDAEPGSGRTSPRLWQTSTIFDSFLGLGLDRLLHNVVRNEPFEGPEVLVSSISSSCYTQADYDMGSNFEVNAKLLDYSQFG